MELKEVKRFLEKINQNKIIFDPHFYKFAAARKLVSLVTR